MQLGVAKPAELTVFVSSGDDVVCLRDLVDDLVRDAINSEFQRASIPLRLLVSRWERSAPGRAADGEKVNDRFVALARKSSVTLCLLLDRLGAGTREEIEAVLDTPDVDLAILWFVEPHTWPKSEVGCFLESLKDRGVFIDRAGRPDSRGSVVAVMRALLNIAIRGLAQQGGEFRERR